MQLGHFFPCTSLLLHHNNSPYSLLQPPSCNISSLLPPAPSQCYLKGKLNSRNCYFILTLLHSVLTAGIYCLLLTSLCTTPGTSLCSADAQYPQYKQGIPVLHLQSISMTHVYKHVQSDWEIQRNQLLPYTYMSCCFLWHWWYLKDFNDIQMALLS